MVDTIEFTEKFKRGTVPLCSLLKIFTVILDILVCDIFQYGTQIKKIILVETHIFCDVVR